MADLTDIQSSLAVKIAGANPASGVEDNFLDVDSSGKVTIKLNDGAGTAINVGQTTMASSVPVAIASNQSNVPVSQATASSLNAQVVGNVASSASDSGNPVKIGGVFNTSLPTLTTGQRGDIQLDSSARQIIAPLTNTSIVKAQLQDNAGTAITVGQKVSASSVPIVIASDQSAVPVSQSGTWTVQQGATPTSIANAWPVKPTDGTNSQGYTASSEAKVSVTQPLPVGTNSIGAVTQATASNFNAQVVGNVASGASDSGNPLKIGGVYNTTLPVVTTGQRVDLQLDANGRLLTSSVSLPTTASKFSFGQVSTASSAAFLPIEFTTYTEPTTNSTMTIVSASASDAAAGTGARTVIVTYLDQTGAGPFTTTFTMNGTTPVTAGVSNMCFIENIKVATVGSTGSNVGILTLKTGGAVTVGTIAATNNQTFWAHHYVPIAKTCYISDFSVGNNSSASGNGAQFILRAATPTVANTPELQVSDFITIVGSSSTNTRSYNSPIQVVGPARVRVYVQPYSNVATNQFASFDFIDN